MTLNPTKRFFLKRKKMSDEGNATNSEAVSVYRPFQPKQAVTTATPAPLMLIMAQVAFIQ